MKKILKLIHSRLFFTFFMLFLQVVIVFVGIRYIEQFEIFSVISFIIGIITSLLIISSDNAQEYKLSWVFFVLIMPLFGTVLYLIFGNKKRILNHHGFSYNRKVHVDEMIKESGFSKYVGSDVLPYGTERLVGSYIEKNASGLVFSNTDITYYSLADYAFRPMIDALLSAKKYIFMEFFILDTGIFLDSVLEVLKKKVSEGVDVRLLYDDMGSINTLPKKFYRYLRSLGIKTVVFNPVKTDLNPRLNYRDHRKMCIIDGNYVFSGGINIADEYINRKIRFGHWKDNACRISGAGVFNYVVMFIQLWNLSAPDEYQINDYPSYVPDIENIGDGFIQSYGDNPLVEENVAENVYMLIINGAKDYIWLSTPYLIPDSKMTDALSLAAKSGVDVRIITPAIPDKKVVFNMTQGNYDVLLKNGVKIYEYTPGFIHTKMFISDDKIAVVGTANMDFRSFFLHFECGSVFYGGKVISDIKDDFYQTFKVSRKIPVDYNKTVSFRKRLFRLILRIIAPML